MDCPQPSRSRYRNQGCRCRGCRAAERAYRAAYRRRVVRGQRRWGARTASGETWRKLRALVAEYGSLAAVARALRLKNSHVHFRGRATITVRNYARVNKLFRQVHDDA